MKPAHDAPNPTEKWVVTAAETLKPDMAADELAVSAASVAAEAPATAALVPASEASEVMTEPAPSPAVLPRAAAMSAESSVLAAVVNPALASPVVRFSCASASNRPKKRGWLGFTRRSEPDEQELEVPACCKLENLAPPEARSLGQLSLTTHTTVPVAESKQLLDLFAHIMRAKLGGVVASREIAQLPELAFNPFVMRVTQVIEDESDSPGLCEGELDATMFLLLLSVFHHATPDHENTLLCTGAFKCFDRDGVFSRDDLIQAVSLTHSTVPVAEIELKVELVMEAAGQDKDDNPSLRTEALLDSFKKLSIRLPSPLRRLVLHQ